MNRILQYFVVASIFVSMLCSCSKHDYRCALPAGCTMIASVDFTDKNASEDLGFLTKILKMDDPSKCGIDISNKVYLFESADGNFGLCAKVSDESALQQYQQILVKDGLMQEGPVRDDVSFGIVADKFVAGWNDNALLIMGPVLSSGQKDMMQRMAALLEQGEDDSMLASALMEKLETQQSSVAMVAQTTALPQQLASLFTIGAPKDTDPSLIAFCADLDIRDDMLVIDSEPFSENNATDEYIKKSYSVFRQIGDTYLQSMDNHDFMGLFVNVDGKKFLPVLQQSGSMQTMLAGVNQAIDMNAIVKSVNGDMYIGMPQFSTDKVSISMAAMLGNSTFLNDISYWKKSVPSGAQIIDWKNNAYCYQSSDLKFYFGVQNYAPLQFYASTSQAAAEKVLTASDNPITDDVAKTIKGKRLAVVMSLGALLPSDGGISMLMLPSLMKVKYVVYTVK